MHIAGLVFESIGLILGSIIAAVLLCALLWRGFQTIGHPAWGAPVTLLFPPLAFMLSESAFLEMTAIYSVILAVPLWFQGMSWRARHLAHQG